MRDDLGKELKKKLGGHQPEWDKDGLWAKIEPALPEEEKKRRPFFWWLLPGLLLLGLMSYWLLLEEPPAIITDATNNQKESSTLANEEQANTVQNSIFAPTINEATKTTPSSSTPKATITASQTIRSTKISRPAIQKTSISSRAAALDISISPSTNNKPVNPAARAPLDEAGIPVDQPKAAQAVTSSKSASPSGPSIGSFASLAKLPAKSLASPPPSAKLNTSLLDLAPPSPWHWSGELLFGIGKPIRQLESTHADLHAALDQKAKREALLESLHTKALLTLHHRSGFFLRSGLELMQFNERFTITDTIRHNIRVLSDTAFVSYFSGVQFFADSVDAVQYQERTITQYNQHRFVQLPLLVGFEKHFGKMAFDLHGGVAFGLHYNFSGRFHDLESVLLEEADLEARSYFDRGMRLGILMGGNAIYKLGRRYSLIGGVAFQYNPQSLVSAAEGFDQRYHTLNIQVGIRKKLW